MDAHSQIVNASAVTEVYGRWPSFHDAEVHWMRLERVGATADDPGPTLEALVHAFEMTTEVGPDGRYVLRNHILVHFRFQEVVDLELSDWGIQNVLFGLAIRDIADRQLERSRFEVEFTSSFGVCALFLCRRVEVMSATPCSAEGVRRSGDWEKQRGPDQLGVGWGPFENNDQSLAVVIT
ncbi:Imm50 family immunity protein [Paludisphaera rhizosphaerae]|uniref:Imm50 family immunity protein n=1 Tax=Paludisphaera rhizosphaerae TaxID=2711216 RepID=UPI0013EBF8AE|nr:Imm50 family immunity protein [Paludisphaera rhizosphaerae]